MGFSLGKPILALLVAAAASGAIVAIRPAPARPDLVIWTFSDSNAAFYRDSSLLTQFHARRGISAGVSLRGEAGENIGLASAFMSGARASAAPDLCEIEINSIGQFLRPPARDIGLLPLNGFLARSGWTGRILASRLASWSKFDPVTGEWMVYGIPEDAHPVAIAYRKDLFNQAGIDLSRAATWDQFQHQCDQFQKYWSSRGHNRRAIALSTNNSDELVQMLLQRHVNLVDASDQLHFTDPKVLETVIFYTQLVAGAGAIAGDPSPGVQWTEDFRRGEMCAIVAPDWKAEYLRKFCPDLEGTVALMPLPRFDPDDSPTATFGGTMMGISRECADPQAAWDLLEFLVLGPRAHRAAVAAGGDILPAIPEYWADPAYHRPDSFFAGNSSATSLYVDLARQIPERIVTPYTYQAQLALGVIVHRAVEYLNMNGTDGLSAGCSGWLVEAQNDLNRRIEFGKLGQ